MIGRKVPPEKLRVLHADDPGLAGRGQYPQPPEWLKGEALEEWHRIVPELVAERLAGVVDTMILASYCAAYARWRECEAVIAREGMTYTTETGTLHLHPAATLSRSLLIEMRRIASEFGFTPLSRTRLSKKRDKSDDKLGDFLLGQNAVG